MKANEFKKFQKTVRRASKENAVWWAGFLWMDLTDGQARQITQDLTTKAFCKHRIVLADGKMQTILPSGITVSSSLD